MASASPLLAVIEKPAILIGIMGNVPGPLLAAVQEGIEEEGIPCELTQADSEQMRQAASQLAKASRINVGLVISQLEKGAVLHHRDLPEDQPLFELDATRMTPRNLHCLGQNAARLVKGNPFIIDNPVKDIAG
jgi:hypothetical protein